jgi:GntR family transcriptional regulator/MocR family aminotransferase
MLAGILREQIKAGEWRHGPLPSGKQLEGEYQVGRDTVLRAVDIPRQEGLVFTVKRRGTYVKT